MMLERKPPKPPMRSPKVGRLGAAGGPQLTAGAEAEAAGAGPQPPPLGLQLGEPGTKSNNEAKVKNLNNYSVQYYCSGLTIAKCSVTWKFM